MTSHLEQPADPPEGSAETENLASEANSLPNEGGMENFIHLLADALTRDQVTQPAVSDVAGATDAINSTPATDAEHQSDSQVPLVGAATPHPVAAIARAPNSPQEDAIALNQLREILFGADVKRLHQYTSQLEQTNQQLSQRTAQLEEQVHLLEDHLYDPERLTALLRSVVAEAIRDRVHREPGVMAGVLGPEMGQAIQAQIITERESIVTALSPVIGATVSEYVRDSIQAMNDRIAQALTPSSLFRKASGRPDDPKKSLALKGATFSVQAVYLIHRATGLIVSEVQQVSEQTLHPSMAALLEKIQHQVQLQALPLGECSISNVIEQGGLRIFLEIAEYCYVAAVTQGIPPDTFLQKLRETLNTLVLKHDREIRQFEGNQANVPKPVHDLVGTLIERDRTRPARARRRSQFPVFKLGLLLILTGILWALYRAFHQSDYQLEQTLANAMDATPELSVYRLNADIQGETLQLTGRLPNRYLRNRAEQIAKTLAPTYKLSNDIIVVDTTPQIATRIYFDFNSSTVKPEDIDKKLLPVKQFLQQNSKFTITITGHTHPSESSESSSTAQRSSELALNRAQAVQLILEDLGIDRRRIAATSSPNFPSNVTSSESEWLSRTVLFELN